MLRRGLALSLVLAMGSIVQAGAVVSLVPSASTNPYNPCGSYSTGEDVTVEVMLSQSGTVGDHYLRLVQFDFTASNSAFSAPLSMTWESTTNHFAHTDGTSGVDIRLSNTFHGDLLTPNLERDTIAQTLLPGNGAPVKIGEMVITMPGSADNYTLNLLNTSDSDPDRGAQVRYGFGLTGLEPVTVWRDGDLSGGSMTFNVIAQAVIATTPNDSGSLPSQKSNVIDIDFNFQVAANDGMIDLSSVLEIRALTPNCGLDTENLINIDDFSFEIMNGGTTLRIYESTTTGQFTHGVWYAVVNPEGGWTNAPEFKVDLASVMGDVDGSLFTDFGDIPALLTHNFLAADDVTRRADIDGSGFIDFGDIPALLSTNFTGASSKPSGH